MNYLLNFMIIVFFLSGCTPKPGKELHTTEVVTTKPSESPAVGATEISAGDVECEKDERLLYQDNSFSSSTEDEIRGVGIISFHLDINDRLDIYNEDGTVFGELVLNEDMDYFTLKMPQKIVARYVLPEYDLAYFEFDAADVNTNKEHLIIYVNKEKRMVRKTDLDFTYTKWPGYLRNKTIRLRECNLLNDLSGKPISASREQVFTITEVKGDMIHIKSSKECNNDISSHKDMEGWLKWKSANGLLLIDFAGCY